MHVVQGEKDLLGDEEGAVVKEEEFAIVFAAMGVNMETAHFFKQACTEHAPNLQSCILLTIGAERVMRSSTISGLRGEWLHGQDCAVPEPGERPYH